MEKEIIICPYCKESIELTLDNVGNKKAIYVLGKVIKND